MNKLFWIVLLAGVLLVFGCNEADEESTSTSSGESATTELAISQPITTSPSGEGDVAVATPVSDAEISALVKKLAPEHGLLFDDESKTLTGEGFPEAGIPVSVVTDKVQAFLGNAGGNADQVESAVGDILVQFAGMGSRSSATTAAAELSEEAAAAADARKAASAAAAEQEETTLIHPNGVYGDWVSTREEDGDRVIEHTKEGYYQYMQLHYKTKRAMFNLYKNRAVYNHQEYDFTYSSATGKLVMLGPADKVVSTYTVWAYKHDHPIEIWVEKEGSRAMMVYAKKGRAGEPLSAYEIEERERIEREAWEKGAGLSRDADQGE